MDELRRFDDFAQGDGLAPVVRNFDANGGLAGNTLDQDGFGLQGQTQIFREADNATVFDTGFRLEFERRDYRSWIDLRHAALNVEFLALRFNRAGALFQLFFI